MLEKASRGLLGLWLHEGVFLQKELAMLIMEQQASQRHFLPLFHLTGMSITAVAVKLDFASATETKMDAANYQY